MSKKKRQNIVYSTNSNFNFEEEGEDLKTLEKEEQALKVTIDKKAPIEIKTQGKSTQQIESELAKIIGAEAQLSSTPLYPNFTERKSRNYKPFDGSEIQLRGLNAKSITIDVHDAGLGVLTKFKFPDVDKPTDIAGNIFGIIASILGVALLGYLLYRRKMATNIPL